LRVFGLALALGLLVLAMHDIPAEPRYSYSARAAMSAIDSYRAHVSPRLRGVVYCHFTPTCSAYGREVIRKHGLFIGGLMAIKRVARCGPWTPMGTVDPAR
jgi:putative membrane protein insertion efficiency factor